MKKIFAIALALIAIFAVTAVADEAAIQKAVYEGMGVVDVDFLWDVQYQNLSVTVQDQDGLTYDVTIWERDDDDIVFQVQNIVAGKDYSYTISGVRSGFSGSYGAVTGSFTAPVDQAPAIKKAEYDFEDRELDVEFYTRVSFEGAQLRVTDANGNEYDATIREVDGDGFEAYLPGLSWGETYNLEVIGVSDGQNTGTAVFQFAAWDD